MLIQSIYFSIGTIVGFIGKQYTYTTNHIAVFGASFIIFGVLGSTVHAVLADKYHKHKL